MRKWFRRRKPVTPTPPHMCNGEHPDIIRTPVVRPATTKQ